MKQANYNIEVGRAVIARRVVKASATALHQVYEKALATAGDGRGWDTEPLDNSEFIIGGHPVEGARLLYCIEVPRDWRAVTRVVRALRAHNGETPIRMPQSMGMLDCAVTVALVRYEKTWREVEAGNVEEAFARAVEEPKEAWDWRRAGRESRTFVECAELAQSQHVRDGKGVPVLSEIGPESALAAVPRCTAIREGVTTTKRSAAILAHDVIENGTQTDRIQLDEELLGIIRVLEAARQHVLVQRELDAMDASGATPTGEPLY